MRWFLSSVILVILLAATVMASPADFAALVDSIDLIAPDYDRQADVANLVIERGGVRFILEEGVLTLSTDVLGRPIGAAFKGKGRFLMSPPNRVEKFMLKKLCKDTIADWSFKELALFFTDGTADELSAKLQFLPLGNKSNAGSALDNFADYIEKEFKRGFAMEILPDLLQPQLAGRFLARFKTRRGETVFRYDPTEIEEIALYKHSHTAKGSYPEPVCSFHSPDQYNDLPWGPDHENKDLIDSLQYDINCKIWQSAKIDLGVELSFLPRVDNLRALTFTIFDDLMQSSIKVTDETDDSLFWQKLKDESAITVYFNRPLRMGKRTSIRFNYSSKELIAKTSWGNPILVSTTHWYPRYGYLKRARYKLKFACPEQYTFLSVGDKISERVEGDFRITEWDASRYPLAAVSFNYGLFNRDSTALADGTPIEVYGGKSHGAFSGGIREAVMLDIKAATTLFTAELAEYPFDKLWATEIPATYGVGMPGLLHLAWASFEVTRQGYTDAFVAHEVSHQWWGHVVGWDSYHDQWLSEGFAEYMAAWYIQRKYRESELYRRRFFDLLDNWRDDVMQKGSYSKSGYKRAYMEGNDAGPIWMGYRLASSKSSDYHTLVYSKGAYILYMLRMLMYDFAGNDDSRFMAMLKDFIDSYYWKEASTADFIRIAEKHYGGDLSWFFDQYVYDIQVPYYRWKASSSQDPDGQYLVSFDIETRNVTEDFQMLVPVTIVMEGDYHTTLRLRIDQLKQRITLPKVPYRPLEIVFNTYKSVLCQEKEL
ncbi:MAG: hypothetical protein KAT58_07890 [candidate division Zixibacteria bacterium]|nr:hypothetical protein [candidate division Zixibacteria bacterium]